MDYVAKEFGIVLPLADLLYSDPYAVLTERVELEITLASETCGGVPAEVESWLKGRVEQAVAIEFNRFVAAGQLAGRTSELGQHERLSDLSGFL